MSASSNQATLAYQLSRPLCLQRDMREVPIMHFTEALGKAYGTGSHLLSDSDEIMPEREALRFYLLQHAMGEIRAKHGLDEILPFDTFKVCEAYHAECNELAVRMFYYLVLICTREARHAKASSVFSNKVEKEFGHEMRMLMQKIGGGGSVIDTLMTTKANITLGQYTEALSFVFHKASFSSQFGGSAWGAIADALRDFVAGDLSAEMLLDRAFNLAHNTAPIFNKGMLFQHQSPEIIMVLDVQAAGQVPNLIHENSHCQQFMNKELRDLLGLCVKALGDDFVTHVDWFQVTDMGKANYTIQAQKQVQKYGPNSSPYAKEAAKKAAADHLKASEKTFDIHAGLSLTKIKRKDSF